MKVYVITMNCYDCEGEYLGVYATEKQAQERVEELREHYSGINLIEAEID